MIVKVMLEKLAAVMALCESHYTLALYFVAFPFTKDWGIAIIHRVPKEPK